MHSLWSRAVPGPNRGSRMAYQFRTRPRIPNRRVQKNTPCDPVLDDVFMGVNHQPPAKVSARLYECVVAVVLLVGAEHAPSRPGAINREVNELPGQLTFVLLELFDIRGETKRSTRRIIGVIVFGAHRSNPCTEEVFPVCRAARLAGLTRAHLCCFHLHCVAT